MAKKAKKKAKKRKSRTRATPGFQSGTGGAGRKLPGVKTGSGERPAKPTTKSAQRPYACAGTADRHAEPLVTPADVRAPLADRMRPRTFDEFVGQARITGEGALLRRAIESDRLTSIILWGPPGTGKTSLARVIAGTTGFQSGTGGAERKLPGAHFASFSAVLAGVAEVRRIVAEARERLESDKRRTILFVDEIHRFNKAQQDAFLPHVEAGTVILVGATTENPSFELIGPLLSRCRVFKLELLRPEEIRTILDHALADKERGLASLKAKVDDDALDFLVNYSNGDARTALNALELAVTAGKLDARGGRRVTREVAEEAMQRKAILYDKSGEEHYNIISALHKSLRGSDAQAALYWLARMLDGGEDPLYILRRMVRFAAEDVGLADPEALKLAVAAKEAYEFVGLPEGDLFLAELAIYLAAAPKSNSLYAAMNEVKRDIREKEAAPVPLHIRNAPTGLMKEFGYGKGYTYDHDEPGHVSGQTFLPENLEGAVYYRPGAYGFERDMAKRLAYWERLRRRAALGHQSEAARPGRAQGEESPPDNATPDAPEC